MFDFRLVFQNAKELLCHGTYREKKTTIFPPTKVDDSRHPLSTVWQWEFGVIVYREMIELRMLVMRLGRKRTVCSYLVPDIY